MDDEKDLLFGCLYGGYGALTTAQKVPGFGLPWGHVCLRFSNVIYAGSRGKARGNCYFSVVAVIC